MLYEHYLDLLDEVSDLVSALDACPDPAVAEQVVSLLRRIDLVHREGLLRLVDALRSGGAGSVLDRTAAHDPVVRILLGLYGLADLELSEEETARNVGFFPVERLAVRRSHAADSPGP